MIDWNSLEELYRASQSDNEKVRIAALQAIEANLDVWITEYLQLPDNQHQDTATVRFYKWGKGQPRWNNFDDLAVSVIGWLRQNDGETNEEFFSRMDRLKSDRLGVLLRHRKHQRARAARTSDFDFARILGDSYHLSVWWSWDGRAEPAEHEVILA